MPVVRPYIKAHLAKSVSVYLATTTMSRVCLLLFTLVLAGYVHSNLIKTDTDVKDDVVVKESEVNVPEPEVLVASTPKQCAQIGSFCQSHSDCCSYSCLGYMKRCVSGNG